MTKNKYITCNDTAYNEFCKIENALLDEYKNQGCDVFKLINRFSSNIIMILITEFGIDTCNIAQIEQYKIAVDTYKYINENILKNDINTIKEKHADIYNLLNLNYEFE